MPVTFGVSVDTVLYVQFCVFLVSSVLCMACRLCVCYDVLYEYEKIGNSGDYSNGVPPLPIPNREVKPVHADGTASVGE